MAVLRTADEVIRSIDNHKAKRTTEQREFRKAQEVMEQYQDLRDDVMSMVKNSGMSYEDIHARCGPHPATLENWAQKNVQQPRLGKMRAVLRIIGYDFAIVPRGS
jgi:ribosome-binding protein aMBF1 (putative translation factor)